MVRVNDYNFEFCLICLLSLFSPSFLPSFLSHNSPYSLLIPSLFSPYSLLFLPLCLFIFVKGQENGEADDAFVVIDQYFEDYADCMNNLVLKYTTEREVFDCTSPIDFTQNVNHIGISGGRNLDLGGNPSCLMGCETQLKITAQNQVNINFT